MPKQDLLQCVFEQVYGVVGLDQLLNVLRELFVMLMAKVAQGRQGQVNHRQLDVVPDGFCLRQKVQCFFANVLVGLCPKDFELRALRRFIAGEQQGVNNRHRAGGFVDRAGDFFRKTQPDGAGRPEVFDCGIAGIGHEGVGMRLFKGQYLHHGVLIHPLAFELRRREHGNARKLAVKGRVNRQNPFFQRRVCGLGVEERIGR